MSYNRLRRTLQDYFGFSQAEAKGFLTLLVLVGLILALPWLYRIGIPEETTGATAADKQLLDSLVNRLDMERPDGMGEAGGGGKADSRPLAASPSLFAFDPNTLDVSGWQRLGLPRWLAERIENYRAKGGQFRRKDDLLKIYDFPPELYDRLEPYIRLPERRTYASASPHRPGTDFGKSEGVNQDRAESFRERPARTAPEPFDINMADTTQLIRLKGIGSKLAGRIVKFRDALGGFVHTGQYADIYGLDSLARQELLKYARIQSPVRRIAINTASAEELDRHPFLSRRQAEIIVRYREQHGAFRAITDLKPIRILDAATIGKLEPYLSF